MLSAGLLRTMRLIALVFALGLFLAPLPAESQPAGKIYRIGVLETRSAALNAANLDAFRQGLRELGYRDGQNVEIAYRSSDGRNERFPALASELVSLKVDLILTRGTPAALAARNATQTIPVVMASSGDPVGAGLVASLGRPGGNVTGLSKLPSIFATKEYVDVGGLLSYGASDPHLYQRAATYVDRILKGAKPATFRSSSPRSSSWPSAARPPGRSASRFRRRSCCVRST